MSTIEKISQFFKFNRISFYVALLILSCLSFILGISLIRGMVSCEGMECLAIGMFALILLALLLIAIIILNIVASALYEKRHKEDKKYRFMIILHFLLIFLSIAAMYIVPQIIDKIDSAKLKKLLSNREKLVFELAARDAYDECLKIDSEELEMKPGSNENTCKIYFSDFQLKSALEQKNSAYCKYDDCLSNYGEETLDYKACLQIEGADSFYRTTCLNNVAVGLRDISICKYLKGSTDVDRNMRSCILGVIEIINSNGNGQTNSKQSTEMDIVPCLAINSQPIKEECIAQYSLKFEDCYKLSSNSPYYIDRSLKDICLLGVARRNTESGLFSLEEKKDTFSNCLSISNGGFKNQCILALVTEVEQCDHIEDKYVKDQCYWGVAKLTGNPKFCLLMREYHYTHYHCFWNTINTMEDCNKMKDVFEVKSSEDQCLLVVNQKSKE